MMIYLNQFYELLSRYATVKLKNQKGDVLFEDLLKHIPDRYNSWLVTEFHIDNNGTLTFIIEE